MYISHIHTNTLKMAMCVSVCIFLENILEWKDVWRLTRGGKRQQYDNNKIKTLMQTHSYYEQEKKLQLRNTVILCLFLFRLQIQRFVSFSVLNSYHALFWQFLLLLKFCLLRPFITDFASSDCLIWKFGFAFCKYGVVKQMYWNNVKQYNKLYFQAYVQNMIEKMKIKISSTIL